MAVFEALAKERPDVFVQRIPLYSSWNGSQRNGSARAVQKVTLRYASLHLWFLACAGVYPSERVRPFHQQLVDDHREREPVVMDVPVHLGEAYALQFGRGVFGLAY